MDTPTGLWVVVKGLPIPNQLLAGLSIKDNIQIGRIFGVAAGFVQLHLRQSLCWRSIAAIYFTCIKPCAS